MAFYRPTSVRDYIELARRILRRKWVLLGTFLFVMVLSTVFVLRMPKTYRSTAMILIQPGQMSSTVMINTNLDARLRTLRPMITSRTELEAIVRELNLFPEARANGMLMDDVVEMARRRVEVLVQGRDLFQVSFVHENPKVAQMVAERLSRKLIDESTSDDVRTSREKVDFLRQRTEDLKRELKQWDNKIQQFSEDNAEVLVLEQGAAAPIAAAREQLKVIEAEIRRLEKGGGGGRRIVRPGGGVVVGPAAADPEVRRLQGEVDAAQSKLDNLRLANTDDHPDVTSARKSLQALEAQLDRAIAKAKAAAPPPPPIIATAAAPSGGGGGAPTAGSELARLRADREAILAQIDKVTMNMRELPRIRALLGELERERKRVNDALDTETRRLAEAETSYNVVAANKGDSFKVQDPANLPELPDSPRKLVVIMAAGVLGVLIAFGVALVLVYFDDSVYNEYELSRVTELPVLVSVSQYDLAQVGAGAVPKEPGGSRVG